MAAGGPLYELEVLTYPTDDDGFGTRLAVVEALPELPSAGAGDAWKIVYATGTTDTYGVSVIDGGTAPSGQMVVQVRRDSAADWTSADTTLAAGELAVESDTGKAKIGDGSTAWTSLGYVADKAVLASVAYTPGNGTHWADTDPANAQDALDRMASLLYTLNSNTAIP